MSERDLIVTAFKKWLKANDLINESGFVGHVDEREAFAGGYVAGSTAYRERVERAVDEVEAKRHEIRAENTPVFDDDKNAGPFATGFISGLVHALDALKSELAKGDATK